MDQNQELAMAFAETNLVRILLGERIDKSVKTANGEFGHIAYPNRAFLEDLEKVISHAAMNHKFLRKPLHETSERLLFVDVGCGVGTKVYLATTFPQLSVEGIEITPQYADIARKLISWERNPTDRRIKTADARLVDYSIYDIIYFYRPMCDRDQEAILERRIADTMKKGAYVLPRLGNAIWRDEKQFFKLPNSADDGRSIYIKL